MINRSSLPATSSAKKGTRLAVKTAEMRKLMFASGGRCAMTDCGLSLVSPSGGWIGTVAHIVAAEPDGPRGQSSKSPTERALASNLLLMCATHGREVDAPETGEGRFPVSSLTAMKEKHEASVTKAVTLAITQEIRGIKNAAGVLDVSRRTSSAARSAAGLGETMGLGSAERDELARMLEGARVRLSALSQPALEVLAAVLAIWYMRLPDGRDGGKEFGDPTATCPKVPYADVHNRESPGKVQDLRAGIEELRGRSLLEVVFDEDEQTQDYIVRSAWNSVSASESPVGDFWTSASAFLYYGCSIELPEWLISLDFSIFDRTIAVGVSVPWR